MMSCFLEDFTQHNYMTESDACSARLCMHLIFLIGKVSILLCSGSGLTGAAQ